MAGQPMEGTPVRLLRTAFAVGAVTDGLAVLPFLFPSLARVVWGNAGAGGPCRLASGYGASLMLGWTLLLVWAFRKPVERRFVAALTIVVICGLVLTEVTGLAGGEFSPRRVAPVLGLQSGLLALFGACLFRRRAVR